MGTYGLDQLILLAVGTFENSIINSSYPVKAKNRPN